MRKLSHNGLYVAGLLLSFFMTMGSLQAQKSTAKASGDEAYVDKTGVLRWRNTGKEVCAFGVNYTAMFAHAYRTAKRLGVPLEKAIDDDVYHFSRLGLDAFRVHVWDTEISDTVGNLLSNDHLRLFDYAIAKMKERGMKFVITPIAYWGNGYPERDEKTPGFSAKYGKDACLTDPGAIAAQQKYLFQFLEHVNQYTGIAYKKDPDVIAFEISNEPHHREAPEKVTTFINGMVKSMKSTGCTKPIFYNVSHSVQLVDAYFNADIQGGTFQWYPTGLGARHELTGNLLPNVDKYVVPFSSNAGYKKAAKIVYEFDAADVGRSYIYPAMARSFRGAGMQFASHFAYDPTFMAQFNTEYNTHYMNLAYAPQKALSLKIASEVFHEVPMYKQYGAYPENASFDSFQVSYEKDLAQMVTEKKVFYTNNTDTAPLAPGKLEQVAGFGNSPIVKYDGMGAYFIDRIEPGVWRLEVMPDAIWINDPFTKSTPEKEMAIIKSNAWPMSIELPDLGKDFTAKAINDNNGFTPKVGGTSMRIQPGTYLLVRQGAVTKVKGEDRWNSIQLKEFAAPADSRARTFVKHQPAVQVTAGVPLNVEATVVCASQPSTVELLLFASQGRPTTISMSRATGYKYLCSIPASAVVEGFLRYYIVLKAEDKYYTYPGEMMGRPVDWEFEGGESYRVPVVAAKAPVFLFDAFTDADDVVKQWTRDSRLVPSTEPGKAQMQVVIEKLFTPDVENTTARPVQDYSFRYSFGTEISGRKADIINSRKIIVKGRSLDDGPLSVQVALISKDGRAFGGMINLQTDLSESALELSQLKEVKEVLLPRPYPTFLPYFFERSGGSTASFSIGNVESIQFSIGPGLNEQSLQQKHGLAIESVRLEF